MNEADQLVAPLTDTLVLALLLFAVRLLLVWIGRGWAARWVARVLALVVLIPAIRLFVLAFERPEMAGLLTGLGAGFLLLGGFLLAIDRLVTPWLTRRPA